MASQLQPIAAIDPTEAIGPIATLRTALAGYWHGLALLTALSLISAAVETAAVALFVPLVSTVAAGGDHVYRGTLGLLRQSFELPVGLLLVLSAVSILVRAMMQTAAALVDSVLANRYEADRRRSLLASFLAAEWETQAREPPGRLLQIFGDNIAHGARTLHALSLGIASVCHFGVMLAAALWIDAACAAGILAVACGLFLAVRPLSCRARRYAGDKAALGTELAGHVQQAVSLTRDIRGYGVAAQVQRRAAALVDRACRTRIKSQWLAAMVPAVYQNATGLIIVAALGVAWWRQAELGSLGSAALLLARALSYGQLFQTVYHHISESVAYLAQLHSVERCYEQRRVRPGTKRLRRIETLSLNNVAFAYDGQRPVLDGVSLSINRGEAVAVVGPSGCGKTTLLEVIARLLEPSCGTVSVNGSPAAEYRDDNWHSRVAYVPQQPLLFAGSVRDNIRFLRPDITRRDVERAARLVGIHDDVAGMCDGYDTPVGPGRNNLSGGQRQRITLARALAGKPDLLLLDEPTSALDGTGEAVVCETLERLKGQITIIVVAHRPSTIAACDRQIVLTSGPVTTSAAVEQGVCPGA